MRIKNDLVFYTHVVDFISFEVIFYKITNGSLKIKVSFYTHDVDFINSEVCFYKTIDDFINFGLKLVPRRWYA